MPAGTYYTPADIAQEMTKDALTEAVAGQAPKDWTKGDLRDLFGDEDAQLPIMDESDRGNPHRENKGTHHFRPRSRIWGIPIPDHAGHKERAEKTSELAKVTPSSLGT